MDRRTFIGGFAGGLLTWPLAAKAQQTAKVARIGWLGDRSAAGPRMEAFLQGLRDLGYVEGRNLLIEYRHAEGKAERYEQGRECNGKRDRDGSNSQKRHTDRAKYAVAV